MNYTEDVRRLCAQICRVDPAAISDDDRLIEYGLDSLRSMELVVEIETHFVIELDDEDLAQVRTLTDLIRLIEQQLGAHHGTTWRDAH